ncbi:hypothetical protein MRX96_036326 [Rhipicephalus microplus]
MLQVLLSQRGASGLVLINDTLEQRGRLIVDSFANTWAIRGHNVHILSYDREESIIRKCFPPSTIDRIFIHDAFCAPEKCSPPTWVERFSKETEPFTMIKSLQIIVALLHADVHEEHEVDKLCYLATTTLAPYVRDGGSTLGCKTVHRKPGGRVVREDEEFVLKPDLSITDIKKVAEKHDAKARGRTGCSHSVRSCMATPSSLGAKEATQDVQGVQDLRRGYWCRDSQNTMRGFLVVE